MKAIIAATAIIVAAPQYECQDFACEHIQMVRPVPRVATCVITITYDQSAPKKVEIRYKGEDCEPTLLPAMERAFDVTSRGQVRDGGIYPANPTPDDIYKYRR